MTPIHKTGLALACAGVLMCAPAQAQTSPDTAGLYDLSAVEVMPRPLNAADLEAVMEANYPPARRAAGVSAQVTVRIVVGADGLPRDTRVVASTDSAFDAPTLQAVKLLRFSPARVGGRPVQVHVQVPIYWQTFTGTKPPAPNAPAALPAKSPAGGN